MQGAVASWFIFKKLASSSWSKVLYKEWSEVKRTWTWKRDVASSSKGFWSCKWKNMKTYHVNIYLYKYPRYMNKHIITGKIDLWRICLLPIYHLKESDKINMQILHDAECCSYWKSIFLAHKWRGSKIAYSLYTNDKDWKYHLDGQLFAWDVERASSRYCWQSMVSLQFPMCDMLPNPPWNKKVTATDGNKQVRQGFWCLLK